MRIRDVEIRRTQKCWVCLVAYLVPTEGQFTDMEFVTYVEARTLFGAFLAGLWQARREAKQELIRSVPKPNTSDYWRDYLAGILALEKAIARKTKECPPNNSTE